MSEVLKELVEAGLGPFSALIGLALVGGEWLLELVLGEEDPLNKLVELSLNELIFFQVKNRNRSKNLLLQLHMSVLRRHLSEDIKELAKNEVSLLGVHSLFVDNDPKGKGEACDYELRLNWSNCYKPSKSKTNIHDSINREAFSKSADFLIILDSVVLTPLLYFCLNCHTMQVDHLCEGH